MARYTLSLVTPCCLCVGRAGERGGALYPLSRHSCVGRAGDRGGALYTLSLVTPALGEREIGVARYIPSLSSLLAVSTLGDRENGEARYFG